MGPFRQVRSHSHRAFLSEKRQRHSNCVRSQRLLYPLRGCWLQNRGLSQQKRASRRQTSRMDEQCEAGSWQPARLSGFHVPPWDGADGAGPVPGCRVGSPGLGRVLQLAMNRGHPGRRSRSVQQGSSVGYAGSRGCPQQPPPHRGTAPGSPDSPLQTSAHTLWQSIPQVLRTPLPGSNCAQPVRLP